MDELDLAVSKKVAEEAAEDIVKLADGLSKSQSAQTALAVEGWRVSSQRYAKIIQWLIIVIVLLIIALVGMSMWFSSRISEETIIEIEQNFEWGEGDFDGRDVNVIYPQPQDED